MRKDQMALALLAVALAATVAHGATTVRAKADQRVWQTVMSPSAPLAWPWESGADSAHLSLSNRMTRTVTTHVVEKSGDDLYGSFAVTPPAPGEEAFYIAELVLFSGGDEVARYSADLAYVNGVAGRAFDLRPRSSKEWRRFSSPRLSSYDAAWSNATASAASAALTVTDAKGATSSIETPGTSGYAVIASPVTGECRFDLGFDADPAVWTASLIYGGGGIQIIFR